MPFEVDMPDELPKSSFLDEPGTYHVAITDVDENPISEKNNMALDGFQISAEVLDGTVRTNNVCTEIGKHVTLTFWNPKPGTTEGKEKWDRARQAAFLIAAGLATKADLGKKGFAVDLNQAKGRQIVIGLEKGKDGKFLQIAWANVWAVDDPEAAKYPKDAKALALIGKAPKPGAAAASPAKSAGGNGNGNGASASKPAATPQATAASAPASGDWNV